MPVAGKNALDETDGMEVDSAAGFSLKTLQVLKGRTSPETRLSNEELQVFTQLIFFSHPNSVFRSSNSVFLKGSI